MRTSFARIAAASSSAHTVHVQAALVPLHCTTRSPVTLWTNSTCPPACSSCLSWSLVKTLTFEEGYGEYQFKHLSFQEALFVEGLRKDEGTLRADFWKDDEVVATAGAG